MSESFRDLQVWQRSVQTSVALYRFTAGFSSGGALRSYQSVAPGRRFPGEQHCRRVCRNLTGEYKQFLGIARGSCSEIETQLVIARELGLGNVQLLDAAEQLNIEVGKMLRSLISKL